MNTREPLAMADVQSSPDARRIAIDRVGIRAIRHPVRVAGRGGALQHTIATFSLSVALPHSVKGTHMSRFIQILNGEMGVLSIAEFRRLMRHMVERLEAHAGTIEASFPFFLEKHAPVSGVASLLDVEATLIGDIEAGRERVTLRVVVPVTSLCPCSKEISAYGAHNQRSHVTLTVQADDDLPIEDLVDLAEEQASCALYGLLKRPDEKYVTERAYDNPKFVEDLVRDLAAALARDPRIGAWRVEAENFESIHNHSAWAVIESAPAQG
jgi:GTP cyclohydrolase I